MSVDYYGCDCCEASRYEEYVGECSKCHHNLCTDCLINDDIDSPYAHQYEVRFDGTDEQAKEFGIDKEDYEIDEIIDDSGIDSKHCPFCSGNEVHDYDLLEFALTKLGLSKDELTEQYRAYKIIVLTTKN